MNKRIGKSDKGVVARQMNPVFIFLVILIAVILWFLLSFVFVPLGKFVCQIWKDVVDTINKNDESEEKESEER